MAAGMDIGDLPATTLTLALSTSFTVGLRDGYMLLRLKIFQT